MVLKKELKHKTPFIMDIIFLTTYHSRELALHNTELNKHNKGRR